MAAASTAKKFNGGTNMFLGPGTAQIDPKVLETAIYQRFADTADKIVKTSNGRETKDSAASSALQNWYGFNDVAGINKKYAKKVVSLMKASLSASTTMNRKETVKTLLAAAALLNTEQKVSGYVEFTKLFYYKPAGSKYALEWKAEDDSARRRFFLKFGINVDPADIKQATSPAGTPVLRAMITPRAYLKLKEAKLLSEDRFYDEPVSASTKVGTGSLLDRLFLATTNKKETLQLVQDAAFAIASKNQDGVRERLATSPDFAAALRRSTTSASRALQKTLDKLFERFDHRGSGLAIGDGGATFIEVMNKDLSIRFDAISGERVWEDPGVNGDPLGDDEFTIADNMHSEVSDFLSKALKPADVSVSPDVYSDGRDDVFSYTVGLTYRLPKDFSEQVLRALEQRFPQELAKAINDGIADATE